jgi:HTH-type transcriptional regulator / antitoxin HigA
MNIKPIHNEADYKAALKAVSPYFENEPAPGSADGDYFEVMLALIGAYEAKAFPIGLPDPIEAINFRMDQLGMAPKDLQPMIGQTNRVYEVLTGKRSLTISMIRKLNASLGIPAECLIKPSRTSATIKIASSTKKVRAAA